MALMRQSSIDQMRKIKDIIRKNGGDIADKVKKSSKKKEEKMPNELWSNNPYDRTIDSIEDDMTIDVPIKSSHKGVSEKNNNIAMKKFEEFNEKNDNENQILKMSQFESKCNDCKDCDCEKDDDKEKDIKEKDTKSDEKDVNENTDNDNYYDIMRNMNTIQNWDNFHTKSNNSMREVLRGRQITVGDITGYVNKIEGKDVFVDTIKGVEVLNIKDVSKAYKNILKPEETKKTDTLQGPSNKSISKPIKKSDNKSVALDINGKSKIDKQSKKITNKNQKVSQIKKLKDMSKPTK